MKKILMICLALVMGLGMCAAAGKQIGRASCRERV